MRLLIPLLLLATIQAEEARTLDPAKPLDAMRIVAQIAAQVPLKLADSQALLTALETLDKVVKTLPATPGNKTEFIAVDGVGNQRPYPTPEKKD